MAEVYMNGDTNIIETIGSKDNHGIIEDDDVIQKNDTLYQEHLIPLAKNGVNIEKDDNSNKEDKAFNVDNVVSNDSGINGSYDINDNSDIFNSVVHEESTASTNNVVEIFDSFSSSILNVDAKVNSEIEKQEILAIPSKLNVDNTVNMINITDNDKLDGICDTNLHEKSDKVTDNHDTLIVSSEITMTSVTSDTTTNKGVLESNDEVATTVKMNHSGDTNILNVNDDVHVMMETKKNEESNDVDVPATNVSESHVRSVDDVPLTESYIKISLDIGDDNTDDIKDAMVTMNTNSDSNHVITGEPVGSNDGISLDLCNKVSDDLNKDIDSDISNDNTIDSKNIISTADLAINEFIVNENITVNNVVLETTEEEVIDEKAIANFVHEVIEHAKKRASDASDDDITVENISVVEASPDLETAMDIPTIDLTTNTSSTVEAVIVLSDDEVIPATSIISKPEVNVILDVKSDAETIDDSKSISVGTVDDLKSTPVEINCDSKSAAVEINCDSKFTAVVSIDDSKSAAVESIDDSKSAVVESIDDSKSAVVVSIDVSKSAVVVTIDDSKSAAVEIIDDSKSAAVEIIDDTKSAAVEIIDDTKPTHVEIVDDTKSTHVEIIDDSKSTHVEIIDDSKSTHVEIIDDSKSTHVEIIDNKKSTSVESIDDSTSNNIEIIDDSKYTPVGNNDDTISTSTDTVNNSKSTPEATPISITETVSSTAEKSNEGVVDCDTLEDEWLDILGNGLLKKKIILKGKGKETRPVPGNIVNVRCEGRLANGIVVDKNEHLQFVLSDEDVIQAFDLAVALMEDNEVATVFTDARYAYGIHGRPDYTPPIPQNASITYEIEVLSVEEGPDIEKMTSEERVMYGDKKRIRGNELYVKEEYSGSINAYKRGIKYLEGTDDENVMNMKMKCLNNLSAAQLKVKAYRMAIQSLDTVLQFEPDNVKALFRKAKCLNGLDKEDEAVEYLRRASVLDPQNKSILQELGRLRSKVAVTHQKEKQMYQKMFKPKKEENISKEEEYLNWSVKLTTVVVGVLGIVAGYLWYKHR